MRKLLRKVYLYFYWLHRNRYTKTRVYNFNLSPKIDIGKQVMIRKGTTITGKVTIGDYSYISGPDTYVKDAIIGKH
jgi:virginiamycin A acetyltransferase